MHLPDLALQIHRFGRTIAAPVHQLVLDVGDLVGVGVLIAFGAVGDHAEGGVLVADIAFGDVVAGLGVHAQVVGTQELVAALERHVALVLRGGIGTGELVAFDVGRQLLAHFGGLGIGGGGAVEAGQRIHRRAQSPVQRLVGSHGRKADGDAQRQGQQAENSAHA